MNPLIRRPSGLEEILITFGDPRDASGRLNQDWVKRELVRVQFPEKLPIAWSMKTWTETATLHRRVAPFFEGATRVIFEMDLWPQMVSWAGAFTFREQRGSEKLSLHSWGIAFDISSAENPLGSVGKINPEIVEIFEEYGWFWGGRFSRPDPMHFQFATGY